MIFDCSLLSLHNTLVKVKQSAQTSTIPYQSLDGPQQPVSRNPLLQRTQRDARMFPPITFPPGIFIPKKQQVLLPWVQSCAVLQPPASVSSGWIPDDLVQIDTHGCRVLTGGSQLRMSDPMHLSAPCFKKKKKKKTFVSSSHYTATANLKDTEDPHLTRRTSQKKGWPFLALPLAWDLWLPVNAPG